MDWQLHPMHVPLLAAVVTALGIALYAFEYASQSRDRATLYAFTAMMVSTVPWSLGYALQLATTTIGAKEFWFGVQIFGGGLTAVSWFAFALAYSDNEQYLTPARLAALFAIPGVVAVLGVTNRWHGLVFIDSATIEETMTVFGTVYGPFDELSTDTSFLYQLFLTTVYLLYLAGALVFGRLIVRSRSDLYRGQILLVVASTVVVPLGHAVSRLGLTINYDIGPILVTLSGIGFAVAMFRYRLFDIEPAAREVAVQHMRDGYVVVAESGMIRDCNEAARELLRVADPVGRPVEAVLPAADDSQLLSASGTTPVEFPDGTSLEVRASPIENHRLAGQVLLLRDVTQERERKRELEQSRQLLDSTQQLADVGGWQVDVETERVRLTDETRRILDVPPAQTSPELAETVEYFHPDDQETVETAIENCITAGSPFDIEVRAGIEGEKPVWVQVQGHPVYDEANEQVIRIQGAIQDITERYERERQLERKNERLDQFASVISHDLRNPLNAAKLRFDHIREMAPEEHAARVQRNLDRMEAMIDDLLTMSRAGKTVDEPEAVSLAAVATDSWDVVETGGATLDLSVPESTTVTADRDRLQQVFENLFRNSVEHGSTSPRSQAPEDAVEHGSTSPASGTDDLTVRVGLLEDASEGGDGPPTGFFVADDGDGIPEDEREEIFDHGFTTSDEGTGFGLSIIQDVVDAHGWEMKVCESDEGGARFEMVTAETGSERRPQPQRR